MSIRSVVDTSMAMREVLRESAKPFRVLSPLD
jgi:hypothetical protein